MWCRATFRNKSIGVPRGIGKAGQSKKGESSLCSLDVVLGVEGEKKLVVRPDAERPPPWKTAFGQCTLPLSQP